MTNTFYLFALTPRAGRHHHVYIQPTSAPLGGRIPGVEGKDRVNVNDSVEQLTHGRKGLEYLVFVALDRELSTEAKTEIRKLLENYQGRLAELVTKKIDWNKEGGMFIQHPDLDRWMDDLRPEVAGILATESKKRNWVMRHKRLCAAVIVLMVFLVVTVLKGQDFLNQIIGGGERRIDLSKFFGGEKQPEPTDVRDDWISALKIQSPRFPSSTPEQKERAIREKLSSLFEVKMRDRSLRDRLLVLNVCFGNPVAGAKPELQELLANEKLRVDIADLVDGNDKWMNRLTGYNNDEVKQTLYRYLNEGRLEERAKRFADLRRLLTITIEIGKKVAAVEEIDDAPWIRFARLLYGGSEGYFLKDGDDLSAGYIEVRGGRKVWTENVVEQAITQPFSIVD